MDLFFHIIDNRFLIKNPRPYVYVFQRACYAYSTARLTADMAVLLMQHYFWEQLRILRFLINSVAVVV